MEQADSARFSGKVAVITGSSRGIGRATALRVVDEGGCVVLNGRDEGVLAELSEELGSSAVGAQGSISDPDLAQRLVAAAYDNFGGLDVIVNNAATSAHYGPLLEAKQGSFEKTMLANTWPAVAIVAAAVQRGFGPGAVINVSTTGAQRVHPVTGPYTASKAALEMITQLLAHELGPRGIRVNGVAPGLVKTDLARVLWEGDREAAEADLVPLTRLGQPEDIASAICYLASDDAGWITGVVLPVDGGRRLVGGEPRQLIGGFSGRPVIDA